MQSQVIFRERQELPPSDLNNIEAFAREAIDTLIADAVGTALYFSGFDLAQTNTWELTIGTGRRYAGGEVFARRSSSVFDLFARRPLSQKRMIALCAWGKTVETDVQPRDFVLDVETGETEPQSVAMERLRSAELQIIEGSEAAQPSLPNVPADNVVIAYVRLGTGGIETIEIQERNRVPQLARQLEQIRDLIEFQARTGISIERLRTDLFSVAQAIGLLASKEALAAVLDQVRAARDVADRALAKADSAVSAFRLEFIEQFLSDQFSDTGSAGYAARIDQGLKFPRQEIVSDKGITLLAPNDPKVSIVDGRMTPVPAAKAALDNSASFAGSVSLLGYTTTNQTTRRVTKTRRVLVEHADSKRLRTGNKFPFGTQGRKDAEAYWPATKSIGGRTYRLHHVSTSNGDFWNEAFYLASAVYKSESYQGTKSDTVTRTIPAQGRAQTFVVSSAGRLKDIALYLDSAASGGDLTVLISKADGNNPDQTHVVAETTVAAAALKTGKNVIPLPAEYLSEGRYAWHVLSTGDHRLRMSNQPRSITQGEHFAYNGDNQYLRPSGEAEKDLAFTLNFQAYSSTQVIVDLNPVSASGGMDGIVLEGVVDEPVGTDLYFRAQIGGQWQVLDLAEDGQRIRADFSSRPSVVPLQVVFEGTLDKMPSVSIGNEETRAIAIQQERTLRHVSDPIAPAAGQTSKVRLTALLNAFAEDEMDCTLGLLVGGAAVAASETTDILLDNGDVSRTAVFDLASPAASYQAVIDGSVEGAGGDYVVERLSHFIGA